LADLAWTALDWFVGILLWKTIDFIWSEVYNFFRMRHIRKLYGR